MVLHQEERSGFSPGGLPRERVLVTLVPPARGRRGDRERGLTAPGGQPVLPRALVMVAWWPRRGRVPHHGWHITGGFYHPPHPILHHLPDAPAESSFRRFLPLHYLSADHPLDGKRVAAGTLTPVILLSWMESKEVFCRPVTSARDIVNARL